MYFSGQMLDEYAKHVEKLCPDSIADYVGDECDPVDRSRAAFAGIITSVTLKNTKNGDRMAFFELEDRFADIECVAFARQYAEHSYLIHTDAGVYVSGSISLREDEPPKLLVNRIEPLIENGRFDPSAFRPTVAEETSDRQSQTPVQKTNDGVAKKASTSAPSAPKRLFLRVPSAKCDAYFKALNLAELFDGSFPAFFYFADEKRYETAPIGVALSAYVLEQFRVLLGEENVILK